MMKFQQNMPTKDWAEEDLATIIAEAYVYQSYFIKWSIDNFHMDSFKYWTVWSTNITGWMREKDTSWNLWIGPKGKQHHTKQAASHKASNITQSKQHGTKQEASQKASNIR